MLRVTAQGIEELRNLLEKMAGFQEDDHAHIGSTNFPRGGDGCGCGTHDPSYSTEEDVALRLVVTDDGGFGMILDIPRNGDQLIERDGVKLLLIGHELKDSVRGMVLDCEETPRGRKLVFVSGST